MVVPTTALTGQDQIWVVEDQKLSQRQVIRLGEQSAGQEVIVAPFDYADGVVVLPPLEGREGQQVTIRNEVRASSSLGGLGDGSR